MTEHDSQVALFQWADLNKSRYPELSLMFAIPNGAKLPYIRGKNGKRFSPEAARLKAEGLRAGVPDLFLPSPRGRFHGLFVEMKFGKNTLSPEQAVYLETLEAQGYCCVICWTWEEAAALIVSYLEEKL